MRAEILEQATILMVDDDPAILALLSKILRLEGYRHVQTTDDPCAIRELFAAFQPDLVVLDLMMPGCDGYQVLAELRALVPGDSYLPILILSADISKEASRRSLEGGATDFITKPFDAAGLARRIGILLDTRFLHLRLQHQNRLLKEMVSDNDSLFRAVIEGTDDAVFVKDLEGRYLMINAAEARYRHRDPEAIVGKMDAELFPPEEAAILVETHRRVLAEGATRTWEETTVENGMERTHLVTKGVYRDRQGAVLGTFGIARDITQRKLDEQAMAQSERRFRALFDDSLDAILLADDDMRYVDANPAACRLTGYSREELLRMSVPDITAPAEAREAAARWAAFREAGRAGGEQEIFSRDGCQLVAEFRSVANVLPGLHLAVLRDITDRRLSERALVEAKTEAERANRAKSEFLSRMSHELRTPLNAILGFAQLFEPEQLSAGDRESVEHILRAGGHLLRLINEVLNMARIEAGQVSLSLEAVRLSDVLDEVRGLMTPLAAQRRITWRQAPELDSICVMADRQKLHQVLLNLASNAVKYNREDGTLTIGCQRQPQSSQVADTGDAVAEPKMDQVRIEVSDHGGGLTEPELARVFEPFERLGAERRGIEGTGIGLSISRRLTELMGGSIGAHSTVGQGSTFWVELPGAQDPLYNVNANLPSAPSGAQGLGVAPRTRKTILYVEDNLSNLKLVERLLQFHPHSHLIAAMQGSLGVDLAREHRPDLILLDLHLPDINGDEVLRRLQADSLTRELPVVMISADATAGQQERLLAGGAVAYLTKPLDVKQFLQLLEGLLRGKEE